MCRSGVCAFPYLPARAAAGAVAHSAAPPTAKPAAPVFRKKAPRVNASFSDIDPPRCRSRRELPTPLIDSDDTTARGAKSIALRRDATAELDERRTSRPVRVPVTEQAPVALFDVREVSARARGRCRACAGRRSRLYATGQCRGRTAT